METSDFDYRLPPELIAQTPALPRDTSRLMVVNRHLGTITHDYFYNLTNYLSANDMLVFNESKVLPARLFGHKMTGGKVEILLLKQLTPDSWEAQLKGNLKEGQQIKFGRSPLSPIPLIGLIVHDSGLTKSLQFNQTGAELLNSIHQLGEAPLPPYIKRDPKKFPLYQTIYAKTEGSAAAPTAGFHFTAKTFAKLQEHKIETEFVTLHVGMGTYAPVKSAKLEDHRMHSEWYQIPPETAWKVNEGKNKGKEVLAVGTTSLRTLESATVNGKLTKLEGETSIFIYPGYKFQFVDKLLTNFHLPKSTLLMLVSAFAGKDFILSAYEEAKREKYHFFSFGDAMLII